jgi:hypothetical protein
MPLGSGIRRGIREIRTAIGEIVLLIQPAALDFFF